MIKYGPDFTVLVVERMHLLWAYTSSSECHVWKCAAHTHTYQNGSHHQKSNTSFYSICPYESTRGRYLQTDPFFIHRHDFFFLNRHDETHYFPTLPKNSILIFPMYLDLTETSSHKLKNLSVSNLYHYLNKLTFAFNYSN